MGIRFTFMFRCIALALTIHEQGHLSCRATVQHEDKEASISLPTLVFVCSAPTTSSSSACPPPDGGQIVSAAYKYIVRRPPNELFKVIVT